MTRRRRKKRDIEADTRAALKEVEREQAKNKKPLQDFKVKEDVMPKEIKTAEPEEEALCGACQTTLSGSPVNCPGCGAILDWGAV